MTNFDPMIWYPPYDGMTPVTAEVQRDLQDDISCLIGDMTMAGAEKTEMVRAIRHSLVVLDAHKHNLDYKQSAVDNGIRQLRNKYQHKEFKMTEQHPAVVPSVEIVVPPKPSSTRELELEADIGIRYLEQFTSSSRLDPDLRMALTDIKNTIKNLKITVVRQSEEAQRSHDNLVEVVRSQRLM